MKNKLEKLNYIFFLILPFIDLITSLSSRYISFPISIGIITKGLFTILIAIYVIFYTKTKHKKHFVGYIIAIIVYCFLFILTKKHIWNSSMLLNEFISLYKFIFTGYIIFVYIILKETMDIKKYEKLLFYSLICYVVLLLVPHFTSTEFKSYKHNSNVGSIGWFYSANEISAIILMLLPSYFNKIKEKLNQKKYLYCLLIIPVIYSIFIIGTKTSWYGLILLTIVIFIIYIIKEKKEKILITFILIIICSLFLLNQYSPTTKNLETKTNKTEEVTTNNKETLKTEETKNEKNEEYISKDITNYNKCGKSYKFKNLIKNKKIIKITNLLLSGRENKAYTLLVIYKDANITNKLLGLGFNNNSTINNCYIQKYIEIDVLDGLVHFGIIGLLFLIYPFVILLKSIKIKELKKLKTPNIIYLATVVLIIGLSLVAGHIIGYPTTSIYLSIIMVLSIKK